ncbi:MAG: hypothetical protein QOI41_5839, partial [Myxococcales bacterium]|nr:hypothetical protein [Myxococcales bacterium]
MSDQAPEPEFYADSAFVEPLAGWASVVQSRRAEPPISERRHDHERILLSTRGPSRGTSLAGMATGYGLTPPLMFDLSAERCAR